MKKAISSFEKTANKFLCAKTSELSNLRASEIVKGSKKQLKGIDIICDLSQFFVKEVK